MIKEVRAVPNAEEFLAHSGVKGMKWGVINEKRDEKINESHGKIYDTVNKVGAALGIDKAKDNVAAKEEKAAADKGIKRAEQHNEQFTKTIYETRDPKVKLNAAEDYLWGIRGNMSLDTMHEYEQGNLDSTEKLYQAAKEFDLLMGEYAKRHGNDSIEDNLTFQAMKKDSEDLDDLYNKLRDNGVEYPENDPEYVKKYEEVHNKLDRYASDVAISLGIPSNSDKEAFQRIKDDLKVLWFKTGYTNLNGYDNTDWSQYGEAKKRREQRKKDKQNDSSVHHSDMSDYIELPYLAHHGIKGQKWGIRRFQNYDGTLIKSAGRKEKKHYEYDSGTKEYKKSEARHLTDEELKKRVNRLTQENNYRDQLKKAQEASMSKRKKLVNKIFVESAQNAASTVMQTVYTKSATAFLKNNFPALMGEGDKKKKSTSA